MIRSLNSRPGTNKQSQTKIKTLEVQPIVSRDQLSASQSQSLPTTALLARRQPIDMSLPGEKESIRLEELYNRNKNRRFRRGFTKVLAGSLAVVFIFGGLIFSQGYLKLHKVFRASTETAAALKSNVNPDLLKGEGSGRINVLLMGRGGGNHEGPDLTDSMMIASIDPVNNNTTLLSLPRDLWINVDNAGVMKLNSVWESGEFKYTGKITPGSTDQNAINAGYKIIDSTIKETLGISIDYNALVDFQAFKQAVTALNGITVNVPTDLVDPTMAWENHHNPVLAKAGSQTLNGNQALNYVRSRETSNDFARAERQRAVLQSIVSKSFSVGTLSNPIKITNLFSSFGDNVNTDLSLKNAIRLVGIIKHMKNYISLDLSSGNSYVTTANISGQSVVIPSAGIFNYTVIQNYIKSQLKDPYIIKENAKVMILNGTSVPGLATNFSEQLKNLGYNVIGVMNAPTKDYQGTEVICLNSKDKYTKHYLEERFSDQALASLPNNIDNTNGAEFVIIIGSNEAGISQNQTN